MDLRPDISVSKIALLEVSRNEIIRLGAQTAANLATLRTLEEPAWTHHRNNSAASLGNSEKANLTPKRSRRALIRKKPKSEPALINGRVFLIASEKGEGEYHFRIPDCL